MRNRDFRPLSRFISEIIQDRTVVIIRQTDRKPYVVYRWRHFQLFFGHVDITVWFCYILPPNLVPTFLFSLRYLRFVKFKAAIAIHVYNLSSESASFAKASNLYQNVIVDFSPDVWIDPDSYSSVCQTGREMLRIFYLVSVSHFAECRENRPVTV